MEVEILERRLFLRKPAALDWWNCCARAGWGHLSICQSVLVLVMFAAQKNNNKETSDSSGGNKHVLRRKLLVRMLTRQGDDNIENLLVPLWLLDSMKPLHLISFKGTQHPRNLASQLGNSKDSWPVEVVLVLERRMKGRELEEWLANVSSFTENWRACSPKKHRGGQKEEGKSLEATHWRWSEVHKIEKKVKKNNNNLDESSKKKNMADVQVLGCYTAHLLSIVFLSL